LLLSKSASLFADNITIHASVITSIPKLTGIFTVIWRKGREVDFESTGHVSGMPTRPASGAALYEAIVGKSHVLNAKVN
jgi:hypothetical protein